MASTEEEKKEVDITKPSPVFDFKNLEKVFEHVRRMCQVVDVSKITLVARECVTYEVICLLPRIDDGDETFWTKHDVDEFKGYPPNSSRLRKR